MAYPGELIRRARQSRQQARPAVRQELQAPEARREATAPQAWQSRHGTYDRLMRSHDRVHTRHIGG